MRLGLFLDLVGGGGVGWTPSQLGSSLLGWWDAERSDLITQSGNAVSSWVDVIAGYSAAQATGASKPTYSATSFNGRPGITFDGVDDLLSLASVPFPTSGAACEIWALCDQTALAADTTVRHMFAYGGASASTARRLARTVTGAVNRPILGVGTGGGSVNPTNASVDFSGRHAVRGQVGAATSQVDIDGTAGSGSAAVPATGTTRTVIGASDSLSAFYQGVISAVLVTSALDATQASALLTYLKARGGIA